MNSAIVDKLEPIIVAKKIRFAVPYQTREASVIQILEKPNSIDPSVIHPGNPEFKAIVDDMQSRVKIIKLHEAYITNDLFKRVNDTWNAIKNYEAELEKTRKDDSMKTEPVAISTPPERVSGVSENKTAEAEAVAEDPRIIQGNRIKEDLLSRRRNLNRLNASDVRDLALALGIIGIEDYRVPAQSNRSLSKEALVMRLIEINPALLGLGTSPRRHR